MPDFFQTYFIDPIIYNTGYNIVNTAVFAAILIVAVFVTYKLLRALKISINKHFFIGILPFIALGGILRSWEDLLEATGMTQGLLNTAIKNFVLVDATGVARNLLLISPIMYVVMFLLALSALLIAKLLEKYKKIGYWKTWFAIGVLLDILVLSQLRFNSTPAFIAVIGIAAAWVIVLFAAKKFCPWKKIREFFTNENTFLLDVHMFDATTTFVAMSYFGYFEQHVVPNFLIGIFGPASMFVLKLVVISLVLYFFDKELKNDTKKRTFLKIVILILGMGPGIRNFLRLVMGV